MPLSRYFFTLRLAYKISIGSDAAESAVAISDLTRHHVAMMNLYILYFLIFIELVADSRCDKHTPGVYSLCCERIKGRTLESCKDIFRECHAGGINVHL